MAASTGGRSTGKDRPSTLAAGAQRASGERARRTSTPLLAVPPVEGAPAAVPPRRPRGTDSPPRPGPAGASPRPASAAPDTTATQPPTEPAAPARETRAAHRPRPTVSSGASRKATAQAGERRRRAAGTSAGPRRPATGATTAAPPAPTPDTPAPPTAGTPARTRPSRAAVRARAAAAGRPAHLRLAEAPPAAGALAPVARPTPDPTLVHARTGALPVPGVEEVVRAAVAAMRLAATGAGLSPEEVEHRVAATLAYVRRRIEGDYTVDEFGYDEHFAENVVFPLLRPIYRRWFRVEVRGVENIPAEGGALVVANHSGTVAFDSLMVQLAVHDEHPRHRVVRALGADLVFSLPFVGALARRGGATLATNADADRLFERGEVVGVFPEGFKGIGKPFRERYKLQRFGRGGFVSAALKAGVPIIPTSVVGAEEIAPILGNLGGVARVLGLPYVPVTPTFPWLGPLGLVPLPSKWIIEFGAPIETASHGSAAAEDPMVVFDLTDQVRETIQQTLYSLLMQRRSVFF
jgi:1-acyl-sn-glycerol-3-phosphate acyltransferase